MSLWLASFMRSDAFLMILSIMTLSTRVIKNTFSITALNTSLVLLVSLCHAFMISGTHAEWCIFNDSQYNNKECTQHNNTKCWVSLSHVIMIIVIHVEWCIFNNSQHSGTQYSNKECTHQNDTKCWVSLSHVIMISVTHAEWCILMIISIMTLGITMKNAFSIMTLNAECH